MITCPECGQQADDTARFCDRCGQGLAGGSPHPAAPSIAPLELGTELKGGYRVLALLSRTTRENRYRAVRGLDGATVQLREQAVAPGQPSGVPNLSEAAPASSLGDPAGPSAKTAELRPPPVLQRSSTDADINQSSGSEPSQAAQAQAEQVTNALPKAPAEETGDGGAPHVNLLTEMAEETPSTRVISAEAGAGSPATPRNSSVDDHHRPAAVALATPSDDLGEVFGRVLALSMTLNHPAFQLASAGFADRGRAYLVYPDSEVRPLSSRPGGLRMEEGEALQLALQLCQAVSFVHRRGLRVNDICPQSVGYGADGRLILTGLDFVSNDNELPSEPIFNDGYTAPEIYRGKRADKRADIFSIGALLYTCLTGERLESETWREEAGPIRFYPPHVVTPALELMVRRALQFDPAARWPNVEALKAELMQLAGRLRLRADALTDVGKVREHNEDSVLAFECRRDSLLNPAQTLLYVVADGMGGAEAGEVASAIAVETIRNYVEAQLAASAALDLRQLLHDALEQANAKIIEYQSAHPETRTMGSTAVAALVNPPHAAVAWVGDSRAYLCDRQRLRQLSKDHSLVQRLIEIGQLTPTEARHHEHKNVITRSLGARSTGPAGAESLSLQLKRGDRLLLCSDGLTTHVEDGQIEELLRRHSDPSGAVRELIAAANAGGGTDNVSAVVLMVG